LKICKNTRRIEPVSSKIFLKLTKTDKIIKLLVLSYDHQENKYHIVDTSLCFLIPSFTTTALSSYQPPSLPVQYCGSAFLLGLFVRMTLSGLLGPLRRLSAVRGSWQCSPLLPGLIPPQLVAQVQLIEPLELPYRACH
jgi:hypothetical protein